MPVELRVKSDYRDMPPTPASSSATIQPTDEPERGRSLSRTNSRSSGSSGSGVLVGTPKRTSVDSDVPSQPMPSVPVDNDFGTFDEHSPQRQHFNEEDKLRWHSSWHNRERSSSRSSPIIVQHVPVVPFLTSVAATGNGTSDRSRSRSSSRSSRQTPSSSSQVVPAECPTPSAQPSPTLTRPEPAVQSRLMSLGRPDTRPQIIVRSRSSSRSWSRGRRGGCLSRSRSRSISRHRCPSTPPESVVQSPLRPLTGFSPTKRHSPIVPSRTGSTTGSPSRSRRGRRSYSRSSSRSPTRVPDQPIVIQGSSRTYRQRRYSRTPSPAMALPAHQPPVIISSLCMPPVVIERGRSRSRSPRRLGSRNSFSIYPTFQPRPAPVVITRSRSRSRSRGHSPRYYSQPPVIIAGDPPTLPQHSPIVIRERSPSPQPSYYPIHRRTSSTVLIRGRSRSRSPIRHIPQPVIINGPSIIRPRSPSHSRPPIIVGDRSPATVQPWARAVYKHPRFWFPDGNLTLVVEDTEYRLHQYLFNDFVPAFYQGQTKKALDRFLSVLYPSEYTQHECTTAEEWISVLQVAHPRHPKVVRLAVQQLSSCASAVDKIWLSQLYDIKEWLEPAFLELALRKKPLTVEEGRKLGGEVVVRIGAMKYELFANLATYLDDKKMGELVKQQLAGMETMH
ncbi:hypothetical protein C8F01DRAFT_1105624 [Mycena amicta]|nr:hypothetical protein C8F01DRAFT_1105624 [Mycena amicta]